LLIAIMFYFKKMTQLLVITTDYE